MQIKEILTLGDAILFAMQRDKKTRLEFSDLAKVCFPAVPLLPFNYRFNGVVTAYHVWSEMFLAVRQLEENKLITAKWFGRKIDKITLTSEGQKFLTSTVFSHQDRMGY